MSGASELESIAADLEGLARQNGWTEVGEAVARWRDPNASQEFLVAAAEDADLSNLESWLKSRVPGLSLRTAPLAVLAANAAPAAAAERTMIVLTAGRLLQAAEVDGANAATMGRTPFEACIVFTRSDRLGDAEDLESLERGAWRLLVPEPKPAWKNQRLREHGIFLWGGAVSGGFLRARAESDADALASWAGKDGAASGPPAEASRARRLLALADQAQANLPHSADALLSGKTASAPADAGAARLALDELSRRLQTRMDADLEATLRREDVSLDALEQNLNRGIAAQTLGLAAQFATPPRKFAETILHPFIEKSFADWEQAERRRLSAVGAALDAETKALFRGVDWIAIERALGPNGGAETLSFRDLGVASGGRLPMPYPSAPPTGARDLSRDWLSGMPGGPNRRAVQVLPVVVLAAVGGGLFAWSVGSPIISVALAGGGGLWVGGTIGGLISGNDPQIARLLARRFVHEQISQAKQNAAGQLREFFALGKRSWQREIDRLKAVVDATASAAPALLPAPGTEARARLDDLRRRILRTLDQ